MTSTSSTPHTNNTNTLDLEERIAALEKSLKDQQDEISGINKTIIDQQQAIVNLTTIVEQQKELTNQLKDTILTLTESVNTLKTLTTTYFEKTPPTTSSPEPEQPVKRIRFQSEETRPPTILCNLPDDPMEDTSHWESQTLNMEQNHRRSPTPSL